MAVLPRGRGSTKSPNLEEICKILADKPVIPPLSIDIPRAERRRIEKEQAKANKTLNLTVKALDDMIKTARDEERIHIFKFAAEYYSAAIALVLHDKWGFGHDRLARVVGQINAMYESILDEYVDIEDIRKALLEETGIKL